MFEDVHSPDVSVLHSLEFCKHRQIDQIMSPMHGRLLNILATILFKGLLIILRLGRMFCHPFQPFRATTVVYIIARAITCTSLYIVGVGVAPLLITDNFSQWSRHFTNFSVLR